VSALTTTCATEVPVLRRGRRRLRWIDSPSAAYDPRVPNPTRHRPIALVLAGGGARGAYEAGAISVLLPALERRNQRPRIVIGTSAGALNASFLAANAHLPAAKLIPDALKIWESVTWPQVAQPLISPSSAIRLAEYAGEVLGVPKSRLESLLDPGPLRATLQDRIDFNQLNRNIQAGALDTVAVVGTSALTSRSVVFHSGLTSPPPDHRRGIDYVATTLTEDHVLASAAIPVIFPAVHIQQPDVAKGWYFDGGTRLNTPIKPAIEFGAERVVVIAATAIAPGPKTLAGEQQPDALEGAGQVLLGLLGDQLTGDLQTLATINTLTRATRVAPGRKRQVPYMVIAPARRDAIGQIALRVLRKHYGRLLNAVRSPDITVLSRLIGAGTDAQHAELLSFLMFAPEFTTALISLGKKDAKRWLNQPHSVDGIWELAPIQN
jgi:NTE family protein